MKNLSFFNINCNMNKIYFKVLTIAQLEMFLLVKGIRTNKLLLIREIRISNAVKKYFGP